MPNDPAQLFDQEDPGRALWNPAAQTADEETLGRLRADGLAGQWARVWDRPIAYYRDKYAAAGFGPGTVPDLDDIPVTTKADLRADEALHPPFGTHRTVGVDDAVRIGRSTGTTGGRPVYVMMGRRDLQAAIELQSRAVWACGVRPGDRFAHSWPHGLYVSSGTSAFWYVKTGALELPLGPPDSPETAEDHVRLWEEFRPRGLMVTGSQLETYVEAAGRIGVDLAEVLGGATVVLFDLVYQFEGPRRMGRGAVRVPDPQHVRRRRHPGLRLRRLRPPPGRARARRPRGDPGVRPRDRPEPPGRMSAGTWWSARSG